MRIILLISLIMIPIFTAHSQQTDGSLSWEDFVTLMADETDDDTGPDTEMFEELYQLHTNPLNLNTIEEEDFYIFPFLSENDIKNIMFYINGHKPLMSTGELMFIPYLERQKRLMLQLFCYAGSVKPQNLSLKKLLKYSQNEITVRTDIPFYKKSGYSDHEQGANSYQGNNLYHSLRYAFSSQDRLFVGLQMEKDAGEKYIDHFSGYAMIKNLGNIRSAIIGDYRLSFGHGLVINTGTSFGKIMKLSSMDVIDKGIIQHSSTSETGYLRGLATMVRFHKLKASAFFSYQDVDGTFNDDSSGISSLKTDGLHRTPLESSKKGNISKTDFGGNIHLDLNNIQLSATAAFTHLNVPLRPVYNTKNTYYRLYNPQGSNFSAYSIAYSYRAKNILLSGETALDQSISLATINQLCWQPNSIHSITVIQRHYSAKYNAINARAVGENSTVHNERGIYLGWKSSPTRKLSLSAYVDAMYFPWLKYQVYGSSYGYEALGQITYNPSKHHSLDIRYRIKSKQRNYNSSEVENTVYTSSGLRYKTNHTLRLQYLLTPNEKWAFKTIATTSIVTFAETKSKGFALCEAVRFLGINNLRLDISATYFNTDNFDCRIYCYESSLLYTFAMTPFYYKGIRTIFLASWKIIKHRLSLYAKIGSTSYFNKKTIGTGLELIDSRHKEDLQIQLRWKF